MSTYRNCRLLAVVLGAAAVCACGGPATETRPNGAAAGAVAAGAPLKPLSPSIDDSSGQILSWVDGQVIADWPAEIREAPAGHRWLSRRHRSGARREVRLSQRAESAAGVELVPAQSRRVQRCAVRAAQDDSRSRSESRESNAAHDRAHLEARSHRANRAGHARIGVDARSHWRQAGSVRPIASSIRICLRESTRRSRRCPRPRRPPPIHGCWPNVCFRTRACSSPSCAPWTRKRTGNAIGPAFGSPGSMDRVVFSCAACHVGRVVVVGQDAVPSRHAQHRDRGPVLLEAADAHRGGARRVRLRSRVDDAGGSNHDQAEDECHSRPVHRDAEQGAPAAGNALRFVAGGHRSGKDADAGDRRRLSRA